MSQAGGGVYKDAPSRSWLNPSGWLGTASRRLFPYRPRFGDRRFWVVQGLVLLIAGGHASAELLAISGYLVYLEPDHNVSLASFIAVSLFFVPVVYAALNFGFAGSIATALWCTLLTIANAILFHTGMERLRELFQVGTVDAIAFFVGQRVQHEMAARQRAETAGAALKASETKYHTLFESTPVAILLLDQYGAVLEANPAAGTLFEKAPDALKGASVSDLIGAQGAEVLLSPSPDTNGRAADLVLKTKDDSEVYLEPALTHVTSEGGTGVVQVLLQDVTEEHQRQAGLRAYAVQMLRAQEDERQRIAQELHDETIQALVLLCRRLDAVEGTNEPLPPSAIRELQEARKSAEEVVAGLRSFARALRPPTLEDLGLATSIRRLVVELAERAHLEDQVRVTGEEQRLPPDTELGIFRIAQEALRNIERHAQASGIYVTLAFTDREVRLDIRDDGVGFTLPPGSSDFAARGKLGLLGMRERAQLLGGRIQVTSSPGKGAKVSLSIPVDKALG